MDGVNSGVSEEKTTPVNDGVGDKAPINDGVVDAAPGNEKAGGSVMVEKPVDDAALVKEEDEDSAPVKKTVDGITLAKEHVDDTASVKERAGESRENRGLVITLCVLGMMIVGLIVAIVVVNVTKGGDEANDVSIVVDDPDEVLPGSVPTEDVVIKDKMEGWDGTISASTQALMFSEDVNEKLDNTDLDYSLDRAKDDYQRAFAESSGGLRFYIAIEYATFAFERLNDIEMAAGIMAEVKDIAMESEYLADIYYRTLYQFYDKVGDSAQAEKYRADYERVKKYYNDWSNYEEE